MKKISPKSKAILNGILDYLDETENESLLPEVTKSLEKETSKAQKADTILVTSVVNLTPSQLQNIKTALQKIVPAKLPVVNKIDKNLLAGFTIKVGDWFLDSSLSHELELFKRMLIT